MTLSIIYFIQIYFQKQEILSQNKVSLQMKIGFQNSSLYFCNLLFPDNYKKSAQSQLVNRKIIESNKSILAKKNECIIIQKVSQPYMPISIHLIILDLYEDYF
ncbi:hypothetical protein ABPG72_011384 [Tetrahymena utriculariae]